MAKSTVEQICTAVRIINMLDRRGKLAVLRDLRAQELEKNAKERPASKGTVAEKALVELLEQTGAKVVTYKEGVE